MSVSSISSATATDQTDFASRMDKGKKDFKALEDALKSGDLEGAKSAFETIKKNKPSGPPPGGPGGGGQGGSGSGEGGPDSDFASLQKALETGDLDAAKEVFSTIQEHMKNGPGGNRSQGSSTASTRSISSYLQGNLLDLVA